MDINGGISKNMYPPANLPSWSKYVKDVTIGKKNNCVILGRKTYELLTKADNTGLANRTVFVVSKTYEQNDHSIVIFKSLGDCLAGISRRTYKQSFDEIYVLGGVKLFRECVSKYLYLCKNISAGVIQSQLDCDEHFPLSELKKRGIPENKDLIAKDFIRVSYCPNKYVIHEEQQVIDLFSEILEGNRRLINGNDYKYIFNKILNFDLSNGNIPILTTRQVDYNKIIDTFIDDIQSLEFIEDGLGFRLRCNNILFEGVGDYTSKVNDLSLQSRDLLNKTITDIISGSKSITIFTGSTKPECEFNQIPITVKFMVSPNNQTLDCYTIFDDLEVFKSFPYFLCYLSILSNVIAYLCGLIPRTLSIMISECQLNSDFYEVCRKQSENTPMPFAQIRLKNLTKIKTLSEFNKSNIDIIGYDAWTGIKVPKQ